METIDLKITKINESFLRVDCSNDIAYNISNYFTFYADNYKFNPKYKSGIWDGKIRLYNLKTRLFPVGLYTALLEFATSYKYHIETCEVKEEINITEDIISDFSLNIMKVKDIIPHDYQLKMVETAINQNKIVGISPTASGKSFIIFLYVNLLKSLYPDMKILIIVPTISLVSQMEYDFLDYAKNIFGYERLIKTSIGGLPEVPKRPFTISTWQTLQNMEPDHMENYSCVVVDECHGAGAKIITGMMNSAINAKFRLGMTGTMHDAKVNNIQIKALLGDSYQFKTTRELIAENKLSMFKVKGLILKYPQQELKEFYSKMPKNIEGKDRYNLESEFIRKHKKRFSKVVKFINKISTPDQNTLVMFRDVKGGYGKKIKKALEEHFQRKVFYVDGSVGGVDREQFRQEMERSTGNIIMGTYGTFSTGVNIKNLHNVIMAESMRSKIKILQTVGRLLRKHESKKTAIMWDITDDMSYSRWKGYMMKHFLERVDYYEREGHTVRAKEIELLP